ncbi:carboxymuconolactone decarboxylase family protein [Kribbella sancticallisti]|uniref:Carboxymuconolactone decarboxylase family protein n=1 Tax=Kribbella sancticallisti TaxID=460087 RepID=A0ABN2CWS2_9ACTN
MDARSNIFGSPVAGKVVKYLASAGHAVAESTLPAATQELMRLRASQINGCGFCTDMHTKDALAAGESPLRLSLVAAWREATVFTEAERVALELTEQGTRIADAAGGVTDEAWAAAADHYDEEQLIAMTCRRDWPASPSGFWAKLSTNWLMCCCQRWSTGSFASRATAAS